MPCAAAGFGLCGTWWSPATAGSVLALLPAYRRRRHTQTTPLSFVYSHLPPHFDTLMGYPICCSPALLIM
ncbi:hypothetical protein ABKV19_006617 [Rosa sericea]